jgi:hypothetical protein
MRRKVSAVSFVSAYDSQIICRLHRQPKLNGKASDSKVARSCCHSCRDRCEKICSSFSTSTRYVANDCMRTSKHILNILTEGPSVQMFQALISLGQNVRELGIVYHPIGQHTIVQNLLRNFVTTWSNEIWVEDLNGFSHDITFLRYISDRYGESWNDISSKLSAKEKEAVRTLYPS